ncbi:MAG: sporulation protein [Candidatus Thorarchaeota archaeon]|nr:sporulation protein [Candidatus Thorarchaeota archaeon]
MRKITIYPDRTNYVAGDTVTGTVEIMCDKDFDFNAMYISLEGREHTTVVKQVGKHTHVYKEEHFHLQERIDLMQPGTMQYGEIRVPFSFSIPENVPTSYDGERGEIEYTLNAKIEVSWARDPKDEVLLCVRGSTGGVNPKLVTSSEMDDGVSVLDVEIENTEICLGEPIRLKYRVDRDINMRGVRVDFIATEHVTAKGNKSKLHQILDSQFTDEIELVRGSWMNVEILTHPEMPVSYEGPLITVIPAVKVVIDIALRFDKQVEIPIVVMHCKKSSVASSEEDSFGFSFE